MPDEYAYPERRKTRSDKRAKARFMRYKRGGAQRASNIGVSKVGEKK